MIAENFYLEFMQATQLDIPGVFVLTPPRFGDARGWFSIPYNDAAFAEATGLTPAFLQDNHAYSQAMGTLRGLHFQKPPHAQGKLVRCVRGRIRDVAVDIREGSPTFGRHVFADLDADEGRQIFVPRGFAHGYVTLCDDCEVEYKVDGPYARDAEGGLLWSDPALGIDWGLDPAVISANDRDAGFPRLADMPPAFRFGDAA